MGMLGDLDALGSISIPKLVNNVDPSLIIENYPQEVQENIIPTKLLALEFVKRLFNLIDVVY